MRSTAEEDMGEVSSVILSGNQKCNSGVGHQKNPRFLCLPSHQSTSDSATRNCRGSAPQCLSALIEDRETPGSIVISKYPGTLHIALDALERMGLETDSHISLMCLFGKDMIATRKYREGSFVKINQYLKIPVGLLPVHSLRIRIVLRKHLPGCSSNIMETMLDFNGESLSTMHNKLMEVKAIWRPYNRGILNLVANVLFPPKTNGALLRAYCSFISDEEMQSSHSPRSLTDLCKWIITRRYACDCLFEGILNIKGENKDYSWKRRHVRWYGYTLYIFDVHTNRVVAQITLVDAAPSLDQIGDGIIKFKIGDSELKMHCDTPASLVRCIEAAYTVFPKILD